MGNLRVGIGFVTAVLTWCFALNISLYSHSAGEAHALRTPLVSHRHTFRQLPFAFHNNPCCVVVSFSKRSDNNQGTTQQSSPSLSNSRKNEGSDGVVAESSYIVERYDNKHSTHKGLSFSEPVKVLTLLPAAAKGTISNCQGPQKLHYTGDDLQQQHRLDLPNTSTTPKVLPKVKLLRNRSSNPSPADKEEEWEFFYQMLHNHYLTYNHTAIPAGPGSNQSLLRNWCANQRKSYMKTIGVLKDLPANYWSTEYLTREKKERLDAAGFYWGHLESAPDDEVFSEEFQERVRQRYIDSVWNSFFERLVEFQKKFGHVNVPMGRNDGLGIWLAHQRSLFDTKEESGRDRMPKRRREKLENLGFGFESHDDDKEAELYHKGEAFSSLDTRYSGTNIIMDESKTKKVTWSQRVRDLTVYQQTYGNCNVPLDYDQGLAVWVKKQKTNKKLSSKSRLQLQNLGFEFKF